MGERVHLTLDAKYVPTWGLKEGLRETIQNWLDAGGEGMPVFDNGTLRMDNPEFIPRESLLIGCSTKAGDDMMRGEFGEGLKLGALAILREGCSITIRTGNEQWKAVLDAHPVLHRQVLAWDITEAEYFKGTRVEIVGISSDEYAAARRMFRWNTDPFKDEVLFTPELKGAVYVKGILVTENDKLAFGYNIGNIKTDRDRKLIDNFALGSATARILIKALGSGTISSKVFFELAMKQQYLEFDNMATYMFGVSEGQLLEDAWRLRYGEAICKSPYDDHDKAQKLRQIGKRVESAPSFLCGAMRGIPKIDETYKALLQGMTRAELTEGERKTYKWCINFIAEAVDVHPTVDVVQFMDRNIKVTTERSKINVARELLSNKYAFISSVLLSLHRTDDIDRHDAVASVLEHLMEAAPNV